MSLVTVVIDTTVATPLPAGATFSAYKCEILAADGTTVVQTLTSVDKVFAFATDVVPGDYHATAVGVDGAGAALGVPLSQAFTVAAVVPPPVATFEAPATMTVTMH